MKKLSIASLVLLMALASCTKDNSRHEPAAMAKILGKWQLDRYIDETRQPDGTLIDIDIDQGEPGDSAIFKNDGFALGYEDKNGVPEEDVIPFTFLNDSTISLDDEPYVIRKLTDTELYLHQEEADNEHHVIDVIKMYLYR